MFSTSAVVRRTIVETHIIGCRDVETWAFEEILIFYLLFVPIMCERMSELDKKVKKKISNINQNETWHKKWIFLILNEFLINWRKGMKEFFPSLKTFFCSLHAWRESLTRNCFVCLSHTQNFFLFTLKLRNDLWDFMHWNF